MKNKTDKNNLVARLRFPEFRSSEISFYNGNDIFNTVSDREHNSDLPILAISQEHGAIPREQIDYNVIVTDKSVESYKVVKIGDFIISLRSFQGGIEYSNYYGICSPAYIILRKKIDVYNKYYKYYFKTSRFIKELNKNIEGIRDGKMVTYGQFSLLLLPKPPIEEQKKIADCLSSLDELITAEDKKLALLKSYKKGLMQKLFPAEGESVPELRFPEFINSGEWEEKKLGETGVFVRGHTYSRENTCEDGLLVLRSSNIQDNKLIMDKDLVFVNNQCSSNQLLKKGDIVICMSNGSKLLVGKNAEFDCDYFKPITIGAFCSLFRPKNKFAKFILKTEKYEKFVSTSIGGGNINNLKNSDLEDFLFFVPKEETEQQKIADCLSSLDDLINAQDNKIKKLKEHKKGLMQGLFPSAADIEKGEDK